MAATICARMRHSSTARRRFLQQVAAAARLGDVGDPSAAIWAVDRFALRQDSPSNQPKFGRPSWSGTITSPSMMKPFAGRCCNAAPIAPKRAVKSLPRRL